MAEPAHAQTVTYPVLYRFSQSLLTQVQFAFWYLLPSSLIYYFHGQISVGPSVEVLKPSVRLSRSWNPGPESQARADCVRPSRLPTSKYITTQCKNIPMFGYLVWWVRTIMESVLEPKSESKPFKNWTQNWVISFIYVWKHDQYFRICIIL